MYAGYGFRHFEIGDVDVIYADGKFHLFHLVLPNHDYIAHAVSDDGLRWERVENALFIGHPGSWDDDMLWTMHVSPNPHIEGEYRMFYTGLSMREQGRVQRVGVARSRDLMTWSKDEENGYPLEISGPHYESSLDEGRHWVSFRDPYYLCVNGQGYLLAAARTNNASIIRRGAAALLKETAPDTFEICKPLHHPGRYDDFEVPGVFELKERYFLLGSIREDVKVHYWYADDFLDEYRNFSDNVLLPRGNYAGRVCFDGDTVLLWNFFIRGERSAGQHLLPPPKEIVSENGRLQLKSYAGFDKTLKGEVPLEEVGPLEPLFQPDRQSQLTGERLYFGCSSGFELFLLRGEFDDYRLSGKLELDGEGKCGLVMHTKGDDGYYISLDLIKGLAQIRYWAGNPDGDFESAFTYQELQSAYYTPGEGPFDFALISFGSYIELSIGGYVRLTLADDSRMSGRVGFYTESAFTEVTDLKLELLNCAKDTPYVSQDPAAM